MKIIKIVVEVVEGQKLTLTGDQLENQPGLKQDVIERLVNMPAEQCEKAEAEGIR